MVAARVDMLLAGGPWPLALLSDRQQWGHSGFRQLCRRAAVCCSLLFWLIVALTSTQPLFSTSTAACKLQTVSVLDAKLPLPSSILMPSCVRVVLHMFLSASAGQTWHWCRRQAAVCNQSSFGFLSLSDTQGPSFPQRLVRCTTPPRTVSSPVPSLHC
jgi:cytochrome c oxidase assembly factor CtaG